MTNRLHKFLRASTFCVGLCFLMLPTSWLKAQPDFFNFSYNGPTTLSVGPTCSSMLQGNVPNPVVTSTMGFQITMSMFDATASGFLYNDLFGSGTVAHVYWFVKDNMGHSHTYEYFINFVDSSPPTFDLTGVFDTLEFSSIVQVPVQTALPVTDNCTPVTNQTFSQTPGPDTCQSGTFTRTWMATDANNNTATFIQTIIIYKDSLPPQITGYPLNGSASCKQLATAYPAWRALQIANFAATDASGIKSLINNAPLTFPPGCKVPLQVKFWAIDNCNIQQIVTVVFSTSDTEGPVVIKPPKDTVAYCSQSDNEMIKLREWISTKAYSQVFDSCSSPLTHTMKIGGVTRDSAQVVNSFLASFSGGCGTQTIGNQVFNKVHGFVSVDFFVKDACGNETFMGNADFGAIDTLPPVITGLNKTEQCGGGNDQAMLQSWINTQGNAAVVDDCSDFTWTNFTFTTSNGQSGAGNFNAGPYPMVQANNCTWFTDVTFRATDDCGNSNTVKLRWSIIDTQAPTFTGLQSNITVYCPNPLPTVPAATVSDNCDANLVVTFSRVYKDSLCDGSYTVLTTWTASDDCGNTASATQNIFVSDTTRPVFTLVPANLTFRCDTFVLPAVPVMGLNIMATDVCSPVVSITTTTVSLQGPSPDSCNHYIYDIIRTFTASDECGNTRTATQTISVIDNLGPVPGGILDTTALCSALMPFPAPTPLATDACSGLTAAPTKTGETTTPGTCTGQYTIVVHWTASDVCGNPTAFNQIVHVIDTVPPTLVNIPANITVECNAIPAPPSTNAFNAADNCGSAVTVNLVQSEIRNPDTTACEHWTDYIVKREWTATDDCGNSRTYTQRIQIEDTTPPVIVPPSAMMFPNDLGECGADVMIPAPLSVSDVCSEQATNVVISSTKPMVKSGPGPNATTPVATMNFPLASPNLPPFQPVAGGVMLKVTLDNADAQDSSEYFRIYDENNVLLGTANTDSQCGDKTTSFFVTPAQVNNWLLDGVANFRAVPNGTGAFSINLVCAPQISTVTFRLEYFYFNTDVPIALTYTLDGGASQNFPPAGPSFLALGTHTVVYSATDCAGNSSTSSVQITINDVQPPSLIAPPNITVYTGQNNCESTVALPFPAITENCAMSANLTLASAVLPLQFTSDPDVDTVAVDISPTLTGLIPNAVGTGILKIRHKGDNAQLGEFFNVYDEFTNFLDTTDQGTILGECSTFFETSIPVTANEINAWAMSGGNTFFYLEVNRNLVGYLDFVSNCAPVMPNGTDGISQVQVTLEYSYAVVGFVVKNAQNQTVTSGNLTGNSTTVTLPPGNYTVMYTTTDNAGLTGMATYAVTVRDTVDPIASCQSTLTIFTNPAGGLTNNYTLLPGQINNASTDNCTPSANLSFALSPNIFNCTQAGTFTNVTLTVTDTSGNSSTCISTVQVENQKPALGYTPVCEGGTLQLLDTLPPAAPNTFTFLWNGPNGYTDDEQSPVVSNNAMASHNGTYCVTITGTMGCTASSCVVVSLAILTVTPVLSSLNGLSFCPGQNIILKTNSYSGQNVSYQWLIDLPSGLVVIGTTTNTTFTITNPPPGTYTYYLKVFADGCNTVLSNPVVVTMHETPPADAVPEQTQVCEGQPITLQSLTPPTGGLTYMWTGPAGFNSTQQNPSVTNNAVLQNAGKYILVTQRNGCFSKPDTVMVVVKPKPAKPSLSGNVNVCAGQTVTLVSNVASAGQWVWTQSPSFVDTITNVNALSLVNADESDQGNWTVLVTANGCLSDVSDPVFVEVQGYPALIASSNAPICKDSLLKLFATFSSPPSDPVVSWCWTPPVGNPICDFQNLVIPNGASGLYQVIGSTSFGCADTATIGVTNVTPPAISFIGNNAPICCDGTTAITLSAIIVPLPTHYSWTGPAFGMAAIDVPSPTIGPIVNCTSLNGQYTLVVKDSFGCPSLPATTGINMQEPPVSPALTVGDDMVCAGDSVLLFFNNPTAGVVYTWNLPGGGTTTTQVPFLKLSNAQPSQSGLYSVFATAGNGVCSSGVSNSVNVTIFPIPATPIISSDSPVCQGGTLTFKASDAPLGTSFSWNGPAGFNSTQQNPVRDPVTLTMAGVYTLKVSKDGCTSPEASLTVEVVPTPQTPQIAPPIPAICIDVPVTAFLNVISPVNGMIYTWEEFPSGIDLQSSTATSLYLGMPNVLALGPGTHSFRVFATSPALQGCNSGSSNIRTVTFDTIPFGINAYAGQDHYACVDNPIVLTATLPSGNVIGLWNQIPEPATVTIDNANLPNATFEGLAGTVYSFQWSLSNGACLDYDRDTVEITAQTPELANGGPDVRSCETTGIQLYATQGLTAQGMWTQSTQQAGFGIVIDDPSNPNTTISGNLLRGQNYAFFWEIGNPGCGVNSDPVVVEIFNIKPNAGSNQFLCANEPCAQLQASALGSFEMGTWWSLDTDLDFTINSPTSAEVCGLKPGKNVIYWTINMDACGILSRDTVEIFYEIFPTAFPDFVTVDFGDTAHVNVLSNDLLPNNFSVAITIPPVLGTIDTLGTGVYVYRPRSGFSGTEVMTYRICNTQCPDACSFATVTFQVGDATDCFIPTIITPNSDGFNDLFQIPQECTFGEGAAFLEVTIFNQWGDAVFNAKPYLNDWAGTYNNEELPAGTYYYVVKLNEDDKPRTGFLLIQR